MYLNLDALHRRRIQNILTYRFVTMVQFINIILIACIRFSNLHDYPNFVKIIFTTLNIRIIALLLYIASSLYVVFPLQCWFSRYGITVPAIKSEKKKKKRKRCDNADE